MSVLPLLFWWPIFNLVHFTQRPFSDMKMMAWYQDHFVCRTHRNENVDDYDNTEKRMEWEIRVYRHIENNYFFDFRKFSCLMFFFFLFYYAHLIKENSKLTHNKCIEMQTNNWSSRYSTKFMDVFATCTHSRRIYCFAADKPIKYLKTEITLINFFDVSFGSFHW